MKTISRKGASLGRGLILSFVLTAGAATTPSTANAQMIGVDTRCVGDTCCTWVTIAVLFYHEEFFLGCTTQVATTASAPTTLATARIDRIMPSRGLLEQEVAVSYLTPRLRGYLPGPDDGNRRMTPARPDPVST